MTDTQDIDVAVVGAGAVGVTAAFDLASEGADVTLYERGDVAGESTGLAAGICYDAFAEGIDAEIGAEAIERFRRLSGTGSFEFHECPYVWFAREGDERGAAAIREQVPRMQDNGLAVVLVPPESLAERFPALRTDDLEVAAMAGGAGYTDPASYTTVLADEAREAGARIVTDAAVRIRIDPPRVLLDEEEREYDALLVAAGAHTGGLLADAGRSVALKPYRAQALTSPAAGDLPMGYDATGEWYFRPHSDGVLAGDGTDPVESDPESWDRDADEAFEEATLRRLEARLSGIDPRVDRSWAGLCTATPDRNPLVGELDDGLFVAAGWHGHGFMRAPTIGRRVASQVLGEDGIDPFDPTRFTGDESFEIVQGMTID